MHYIALVIGNANYPKAKDQLENAVHDAEAVARTLQGMRYTVFLHLNLRHPDFRAVLEAFSTQVTRYPDRVCVFFYAGHGLEFGGENYLVPVDDDFTHRADLRKAVLVSDVMDFLYPRRSTGRVHNVIFLDCCRTFPSVAFMESATALAKARDVPHEGGATWVGAYACDTLQAALDVGAGISSNSLFTTNLKKHLNKSNLRVQDLVTQIKVAVEEEVARMPEVIPPRLRPEVTPFSHGKHDDVFLVPDATQEGAHHIAAGSDPPSSRVRKQKRAPRTQPKGASGSKTKESERARKGKTTRKAPYIPMAADESTERYHNPKSPYPAPRMRESYP